MQFSFHFWSPSKCVAFFRQRTKLVWKKWKFRSHVNCEQPSLAFCEEVVISFSVQGPGETDHWIFVGKKFSRKLLSVPGGNGLFSQFSRSVMSNSLQPHGLQHTRLPCPSPSPRPCSRPSPLSRWCHATVSSSVVLFSYLQSFPASGLFPVSQFFMSVGQNIGASASASVLSMNIQDWFPLELTGLISLQSKGNSLLLSMHKNKQNHRRAHKIMDWLKGFFGFLYDVMEK